MGRIGRIFYLGILAVFLAIFAITAASGIWTWAVAALVFGMIVAISGRFVLGQKWRPEPPKPRSRAVTRRRR